MVSIIRTGFMSLLFISFETLGKFLNLYVYQLAYLQNDTNSSIKNIKWAVDCWALPSTLEKSVHVTLSGLNIVAVVF